MSTLLTEAELERLTGYVKPSKQIEWLKKNGIPHWVSASGRPAVKGDMMDKRPVTAFELGPVR